jgi:DUF971 family protein
MKERQNIEKQKREKEVEVKWKEKDNEESNAEKFRDFSPRANYTDRATAE